MSHSDWDLFGSRLSRYEWPEEQRESVLRSHRDWLDRRERADRVRAERAALRMAARERDDAVEASRAEANGEDGRLEGPPL